MLFDCKHKRLEPAEGGRRAVGRGREFHQGLHDEVLQRLAGGRSPTSLVGLQPRVHKFANLRFRSRLHDSGDCREQDNLHRVFEGGQNRVGGLMDNTLLTREPPDNEGRVLLRVNFDPELLRLFKEVEAWERVGFSIPFIAMENSKDKDFISGDPKKGPGINTIRFHVKSVVADYNRIINALKPWERKLFSDKLKQLDRKFSPAITRMTWSNKGIQVRRQFCTLHHFVSLLLLKQLDLYCRLLTLVAL